MQALLETFEGKLNVLIIGARGGVGGALVDGLSQFGDAVSIIATSRTSSWVAQNEPRLNVKRKNLDVCSESDWVGIFDAFQTDEVSQNLIVN